MDLMSDAHDAVAVAVAVKGITGTAIRHADAPSRLAKFADVIAGRSRFVRNLPSSS